MTGAGGVVPGLELPPDTASDSGTQNMVTVPSITGQLGFTVLQPDLGPLVTTNPPPPDTPEGIGPDDRLEPEGFDMPDDLPGMGTGTVTGIGTAGVGGGGTSEIFTPPVEPPGTGADTGDVPYPASATLTW